MIPIVVRSSAVGVFQMRAGCTKIQSRNGGGSNRSFRAFAIPVCLFAFLFPVLGIPVSTNSVETGDGLSFPVGETIKYNVTWGGIVVARTTATSTWIEEDGRRLVAIRFKTKSNAVISTVYPVDDLLESVIDPETFLPVRFTKHLSEGRYRCHEVTTFDHANGIATLEDRKKKTSRQYEIDEDTRDLISFMYSMRSTSFPVGTKQEFRVMADEKLYNLHVRSLKKERVKVSRIGKVDTVLLEPEAKFQGLFVRKGKMRLWVSEDERRLITKATIKVPVASVVLKLKEVTGPGDDIWVTEKAGKGSKKKSPARRRRR